MTVIEKRIQESRVNNLLKLIERAKEINYKDANSVAQFYFYCLSEMKSGCYYPLDCFQKWFPKEFKKINAILCKRSVLKSDMKLMEEVSSKKLQFGDLTFDNELDCKSEESKRKKAQRFLNKYLEMYFIVEEYGEEKGRYHIHFCGVMKDDKTYLEFHNEWSSYCWIKKVTSLKKASKYLCDYIVKQVPRIRRNKVLRDYRKSNNDLEKYKLGINQNSDLPF